MGWMKLELPKPGEYDEAMEEAWEDYMWWIYQDANKEKKDEENAE